MERFTTAKVDALTAGACGRKRRFNMRKLCDAPLPGLTINRTAKGSRSWVVIVTRDGRNTELPIGAFPAIGADEALAIGTAKRAAWQDGETVKPGGAPTFAEFARDTIRVREADWKRPLETAQAWERALRNHAADLMPLRVDEIEAEHVAAVLRTCPNAKIATAVRPKIEVIMRRAVILKHRPDGVNPAATDVQREHVGKSTITAESDVHPACPYDRVPALIDALVGKPGEPVILFATLTAARPGEACNALWEQIDLDAATWVAPVKSPKSAPRKHAVPLSRQAVEFLRDMAPGHARQGFVFPGRDGDKAIDRKTPQRTFKRLATALDLRDEDSDKIAVAHGQRAAFAMWADEETDFDEADVQACLAHMRGTKVDRRYMRTDAFTRRRAIMQAWADYIMP